MEKKNGGPEKKNTLPRREKKGPRKIKGEKTGDPGEKNSLPLKKQLTEANYLFRRRDEINRPSLFLFYFHPSLGLRVVS